MAEQGVSVIVPTRDRHDLLRTCVESLAGFNRDGDNTPLLLITTDVAAQSAQFSQEIQLQLDFGSVSATLGGYYFNEVTHERATVFLAFPPSPPVIGSLLSGGPGSRDLQVSRLKTDSLAGFGEITWKPTERLELSGGLRYTKDDKFYQGTVLNLFPATQPDPDPLPTKATSQGGPLFIFNRPFTQDFSALTGSATIQYRWSDAISTYASYGRSFKSGGFNTRYNAAPAGNLPVPFGEESVTSYEIGAKTNIGRLRLNLAAFEARYDDLQLIFRQGVVPLLFNAGKARIRGFEAEASYRSPWGLIFDGGLSTLDDDIQSITAVPGATATVTPSDDLPFTPDLQANFGISYAIPIGGDTTLTPRIDGSYQSKITFITGSIPSIEENGYFTGNASLARRERPARARRVRLRAQLPVPLAGSVSRLDGHPARIVRPLAGAERVRRPHAPRPRAPAGSPRDASPARM